MTIAAVAQEVLWEAFVEDSIPLSTCFGAWSAKNESLWKLQVIQIVSVARGRVRAQKEKVIRRMYCEGIIIPSDIGRYMRWWEGDWNEKQTSRKNKPRKRKPVKEWFEAKPFTDLNTMRRKQATDEFLLAVEAFLKEQGERMVGFPYLSFPHAFKGTLEQKVGYAWNSICCFFRCGLVQKGLFPFVDYKRAGTTYLSVVLEYIQNHTEGH